MSMIIGMTFPMYSTNTCIALVSTRHHLLVLTIVYIHDIKHIMGVLRCCKMSSQVKSSSFIEKQCEMTCVTLDNLFTYIYMYIT